MLAVETTHSNHTSVFKRSSSIWRRFSRRDPRMKQRSLEDLRGEVRAKLQKRATEKLHAQDKNSLVITHVTHVQTYAMPSKPIIKASPTTRVVAADMQTSPFPDAPREIHTVPWNVFLTPDQVYKLFMGSAPEHMEDKWFVYSEGPDNSGKLKVNFHRSWTGLKIATLFILIDLKGEGAGKIVGIKWNGTDQTNGMDEAEIKYTISTTMAWVLNINIDAGMI